MAKTTSFSCTACGASFSKWSGRCDACGAWNCIVEEAPLSTGPASKSLGAKRGTPIILSDLSSEEAPPPRTVSGMVELDRVLGGGLVPASAILVGGDPGIGKSTLLLQAAARFALAGLKTIYVSGEEASAQVRMRAQRLGLAEAPVKLAAATSLRDILTTLEAEAPDLVIIDSIQTVWADNVNSAPGSVSQVRAAAHELTSFAKRKGASVILVGHVTKEGQIAGPRVVEHMVDTVLYFEGERGHQFRILRSVKNRFGPADEIGVFEMTGGGLAEVSNPSELFLSGRGDPAPGSVVFAGIEGTRPVLVEMQALVAPSPHSQPRRAVVGWDGSRLAMILASSTAKIIDRRALSQPATARRGWRCGVGATSACISTRTGLVPSMPANTTDPGAGVPRPDKNNSEGLATSASPAPVISNTPISSAGPKRFFTLRRIRNWWPRSPSK